MPQRLIACRFGLKYLTDPDFIAKRISEAVKDVSVDFCQKFYGATENEVLGKALRKNIVAIKTNYMITIPSEPLR